ncbi:hypothetical protein FA13DRAFT_1894004 [Coprinellus micaceus]|uniref:Uncharacterized protein n=1 Tax=Coprinellus micaceus TaxID=71717 RepID=A0A4Y7TT34_COPMI|nr:hypothetical protein FA13DRAFT_1894004 [Coprinellus micaceus]
MDLPPLLRSSGTLESRRTRLACCPFFLHLFSRRNREFEGVEKRRLLAEDASMWFTAKERIIPRLAGGVWLHLVGPRGYSEEVDGINGINGVDGGNGGEGALRVVDRESPQWGKEAQGGLAYHGHVLASVAAYAHTLGVAFDLQPAEGVSVEAGAVGGYTVSREMQRRGGDTRNGRPSVEAVACEASETSLRSVTHGSRSGYGHRADYIFVGRNRDATRGGGRGEYEKTSYPGICEVCTRRSGEEMTRCRWMPRVDEVAMHVDICSLHFRVLFAMFHVRRF